METEFTVNAMDYPYNNYQRDALNIIYS